MSCRHWRRALAWAGPLAVGVVLCLPTDSPAQAQSPEVADAIAAAAQTHGVSEARLRCLAWRESRYSPFAYNPAGPYLGAFQYDAATWRYGSRLAGFEGASPYDVWASAHTTAYLISIGQGWRWPPLRWC